MEKEKLLIFVIAVRALIGVDQQTYLLGRSYKTRDHNYPKTKQQQKKSPHIMLCVKKKKLLKIIID